jgi:hypothetical protein
MVCRGFRPNHQISRRTGVLNVRTYCKVGGPPLCQSVPRYRSSVVLTAIVGAGMPWLWQVVLLWTATLRKDRSLPNCRFPLWCAGTRDRLPRCNRLGRGRAARWNAAGRTAEAETSLPPALLLDVESGYPPSIVCPLRQRRTRTGKGDGTARNAVPWSWSMPGRLARACSWGAVPLRSGPHGVGVAGARDSAKRSLSRRF